MITNQETLSFDSETRPAFLRCEKCGSPEVLHRYFAEGQDTIGIGPSKRTDSTDFVDRRGAWLQRAKKECIVHTCKCCGFSWDGPTLG